MNPTYSELFLKCWEHNLDWMPTLMEDLKRMGLRGTGVGYGLKLILSYGVKRTKNSWSNVETTTITICLP